MGNSKLNKDLKVSYEVETKTGQIPKNVGFSRVDGVTHRNKPKKLNIPKNWKLRDIKFN